MEVTTPEAALKPCPFCGGVPDFKEGIHTQYIMCSNKLCEAMSLSSLDARTVIEAWNTRASTPTQPTDEARANGWFVEVLAAALWRRDYPQGGSIYKTYESTNFHDKEIYRSEAREFIKNAEAKNG